MVCASLSTSTARTARSRLAACLDFRMPLDANSQPQLSHAFPPAIMTTDPSIGDDGSALPAASFWSSSSTSRSSLLFCLSFFMFGTINNILYVVILSAALDLIGHGPKGIILFVNIAPALLVKIGWPYLVKGTVRYAKRIYGCSLLSFVGILMVAFSQSLAIRLIGIAIASFSSGLGEMTYLQLSTVYGNAGDASLGGIAVGWFASGTGCAGLAGAGLWWVLRGLGVKEGLLICSVLPLCMALTYAVLLPSTDKVSASPDYEPVPEDEDVEQASNAISEESPDEGVDRPEMTRNLSERTYALAQKAASEPESVRRVHLTTAEKIALARPLFVKYMLPLFFVYLAEYTINTGVAPTLIYPPPTKAQSRLLSSIIKSLRDYYPLWQLVYQTFVFFSRSSLSIFRLPPLPRSLLPLPTIVQCALLLTTSLESAFSFLPSSIGETASIHFIFLFISLEGLCGGLAYVNVFYRLGTDTDPQFNTDGSALSESDKRRKEAEREFKIASVGFADTLGILVASLVSSALEPALCNAQVRRGRTLCKEV